MTTFVAFLWNEGYREYLPEHANALARQVARHCPEPHRFVCITDETGDFSKGVEVMRLPESARAIAELRSPEGAAFPACYRRLWLFSADAKALGERVVLLDVDCLVVGNLAPLLTHKGDFVGYRPSKCWGKEERIAGGTWMHRTGTMTWVWENFVADPAGCIARAREAGWRGSDQAYLSHVLHGKYALWPQHIGIYQAQDGTARWQRPPENARIAHFNGPTKPWSLPIPWIQEALA
jgi:hypothetical protein